VDQIETDAPWPARKEASLDATRAACPSVLILTALSAIGQIPLSRSAFWGPMADHHHGRFCCNLSDLMYLAGPIRSWGSQSLEEEKPVKASSLILRPHHQARTNCGGTRDKAPIRISACRRRE